MKKLFTLLFAMGSLTTVFAQYQNDKGRPVNDQNNNGNYATPRSGPDADDRDYTSGNRRYNNAYMMTSRERDFRIQRINREYDYKISSVSANRYLRSREKRYQIRDLENQRRAEISNILNRYNDNRNRYNSNRSNRW